MEDYDHDDDLNMTLCVLSTRTLNWQAQFFKMMPKVHTCPMAGTRLHGGDRETRWVKTQR